MTASEGFRVEGEALYDSAGKNVATAGDVNGDGLDDFIIGTPYNDAGGTDAGAAYVIFGNAAGLPNFNLSALTPSEGFKIVGEAADDLLGKTFCSAGDVNGDGFGDLILGVYRNDEGGADAGAAYVIFGKATGFGTIALASLTPADGFKIIGDGLGDHAGSTLASAGDVNSDGLADVIIGAYGSNGSTSGVAGAYVLYGATSGLSDVDLSSLDASRGFAILDTIGSHAGTTVASVGDVNGDGFDDVSVGAPYYGPTYYNEYYDPYHYGGIFTIYGKPGTPGDVDLGALTPEQGVLVEGYSTSEAVGDIDGDGLVDFASMSVGFHSSGVFIGLSGGGTSRVGNGSDFAGVGDFNGDGFDDLIVGRYSDNAAFILFGRASSFGEIDLNGAVPQSDGIFINGGDADRLTRRFSGAGDINGDGFDDFIVGAPNLREVTGTYPNYSYGDKTGGAYVVYGQAPTVPVGRIGSAADQAIRGGAYDDTLDGRDGKDSLYGGGGEDILIGGYGSDTLDGGTGADTLIGGRGGDTYVIDDAGDLIVERAGEGTDRVQASLSYSLVDNLENLTLGGSAAIDATGNALANILTGNGAANVLNGAAGADTMRGGAGNDSYFVDDAGDLVTELTGDGSDTVQSAISYTVRANVENLTLLGTGALNGTGNTAANTLTGNGAANVLKGLAGVDILRGKGGDDALQGGAGKDTLSGGAGNDKFVFLEADSSASHSLADHVTDFATGDKLDLHLIDANTTVSNNQAFHFIGATAFSAGNAGALRYSSGGGVTWIEGDTNGDGTADLSIYLAGDHTMVANDFVL
jgi:Ca2+-binding RTX toxin-like protein